MVGVFNLVFALNQILGFIILGIFLISMLYLMPAYVLMPMFGFLGGWDEKSLDDFRKAALISGPSKIIVTRLYKNSKYAYEKSPWKDKFKVSYEMAEKEAQELMELREEHEVKAAA
jgi:hypothetical protein